MSYLDGSMQPGDWVPNDFTIGDRIYHDSGAGVVEAIGTVTHVNNLHYSGLELRVKWDDGILESSVYPNLQWIGWVDEGEGERDE